MSERETEIIEHEAKPAPRGPWPPWMRDYWWAWLLLLAVLALLLILWLVFRPTAEETDRVTVPNVVGLSEDEARRSLENAGLRAVVVREPNDAPEGEVFAQSPGAGTQVADGEEVEIEVSLGPVPTETETVETETETETATETETVETETTAMPDVVGQDRIAAIVAVADARLWPQTYPVESAEERGTLVAQTPAPGTELEVASLVRLNVSLGTGERPPTEVPDVTGLDASEALERCHEAEVTCRIVLRDAPANQEGRSIDQQPAAGTQVPVLTQVTIYVGR